jgi:uncharacterized membrane protein
MQSADALFISLAQAAQPAPPKSHSASGGVFLWVAILIAVILVGFVLLMWLKRRIFSADTAQEQSGGLMDKLRQMRDSGQISKEEYDATRKAMIARMASIDPGPAKPSPAKSTKRPQSGGLESR